MERSKVGNMSGQVKQSTVNTRKSMEVFNCSDFNDNHCNENSRGGDQRKT